MGSEKQKLENGLEQRKTKLVQEFSDLKTWEERYQKIINMGKALPSLPDEMKTEEAKIKGCQSQVWLHARLDAEGKVELQGDSDAILVRGLVAVLLTIFSHSDPEEILASSADFIKDLGFESNLSPSRTNGFFAMLKQIKLFATAFAYLKKQKN